MPTPSPHLLGLASDPPGLFWKSLVLAPVCSGKKVLKKKTCGPEQLVELEATLGE